MMDCESLRAHYPAMALGALEGLERQDLQAHLDQGCEECALGVAEAQAVLAQLAFAANPVEPPPELRRRVIAAIPDTEFGRDVTPLWAWAIAAVLLIVAILSLEKVSTLEATVRELKTNQTTLSAQNSNFEKIMKLVSSPQTRQVSLMSTDSPAVKAFWNPPIGLVVAGQNVTAPENRVLQLWVVPKKGNPVSGGVFKPAKDGSVLYLTEVAIPIEQAAALAISDEPPGGSPQPSQSPLWVGALN